MKTQYTDQAQTAIMYAERIARRCRHNYIGTEHLLMGLVHEEHGTAGMVLREQEVGEEKLMELIEKLIAPPQGIMTAEKRGYTPRAEKVLENSRRESMNFKSVKTGTEHLLLAMLKEVDCVGTRLLHTMGISIQKLQMEVLTAMGEDSAAREEYGKEKYKGGFGRNSYLGSVQPGSDRTCKTGQDGPGDRTGK